jgi:site-specific recombinase XerD
MNQRPPDRLLRSFERYLRATNRSERTVGNYLENLHQVEAFLRPRGVRLRDATRADLEDFLADLLARRSAATAATRYKVLRVLYRWLEEEEDVPNPMDKMRPPIQPEQPVPVIPPDGLRRLLKACDGKGFEARRDTALIMLLLDTGARRDELMSRMVSDLDQDLDVLLVLGKGRRERALPYGTRPHSRWTATCGSANATRTPTCPGCGSGFAAGSPRGAWSACSNAAVGRPGYRACTPTSSATPSPTSGLPRAAPKST